MKFTYVIQILGRIVSVENRCTVGQKKKIPIHFNANYRTKMKLVLIIMDYCLLLFDALKFFLSVSIHGDLQVVELLSKLVDRGGGFNSRSRLPT